MKFTKFDAIFFDKDGTIFDSEQVCCDAWIDTAQKFNVHFTADMFKDFIGVPTLECYDMAHQIFGVEFPMERFIQSIRAYLTHQKRIGLPIKKGFDRFFNYILKHNIPVGVVTSAAYESTIESFQTTNYRQALDVLVTIDDIVNPKPAPDCYLLACQRLNVKPERVLVFEDSNAGIRASLAAGCQTIAMPDIVEIEPSLLAQCQFTCSSFDDVYPILE
jgi:beta-phosphoglucomutase-like phosphatase (HAD superfamily)